MPPTVTIGMRLEFLCHYVVDEGDEGDDDEAKSAGCMWCACTVLAVDQVPKDAGSGKGSGRARKPTFYKAGEAARV